MNIDMLIPLVLAGIILLAFGLFLLYTTHYWFLSIALPTHPPAETICGWANILTQQMTGNEYFCHSA